MEKINLKHIKKEDYTDIYHIMKSLDKWFDDGALKSILIDLRYHKGYVARINNEIIGFITYFVYEGIGNIGWIGVKSDYQNKKIGKKLLEKAENDFKHDGINTVQVCTLSDSVKYEPYEKTRLFYHNNGLKSIEELKQIIRVVLRSCI